MTAERTIVIIGAGVSGLTTGVALLEAGLPVRLVAEEVPGVTSLAAGAMWGPYLVEPWARVREWSLASLRAFETLAADPATGVRMVSGIEAARTQVPAPDWSTLLPDFRICAPEELPAGFASGYRFTVPLIDMPVYLEYLLGRFQRAGGVVQRRTVRSLGEVEGASVIVNCAGLGAEISPGTLVSGRSAVSMLWWRTRASQSSSPKTRDCPPISCASTRTATRSCLAAQRSTVKEVFRTIPRRPEPLWTGVLRSCLSWRRHL